MAQIEISVADALVRVKTTKARIERDRMAQFITISQQGRISGFRDIKAFRDSALSAAQGVSALMRNYAALKGAIVQSNAITQVTIGKETMTVAAAIERKTSIEQEQNLLALWTSQLNTAKRQVEQANAQVAAQAEKQAIAFFTNSADKTSAEYTKFVDDYVRLNSAQIIDPLGLEELVKQLGQNIEDFLANVDLALTSSNVRTMVTVDLA